MTDCFQVVMGPLVAPAAVKVIINTFACLEWLNVWKNEGEIGRHPTLSFA